MVYEHICIRKYLSIGDLAIPVREIFLCFFAQYQNIILSLSQKNRKE